jgi:DUF4097 and DUF4098 domain-containing protein YvlB
VETGGGRVNVDRLRGPVTVRAGGGEILLGDVQGTIRSFSGGGVIRVQRAGADSVFETAGGDIYVKEAVGPIQASTGGGNIVVERAGSSVTTQTAGGLIEVRQAGGPVIAQTSAGPIEINSASGIRCESAAGAIRLRGVSGELRASTMVGDIITELLPGGALSESSLTSGSGNITVWIPGSLPMTIRADSMAGVARIVSDFPEIRTIAGGTRVRSARAEGDLNGGGPVLRISASNGVVYLKRAK